MRLKFYILCFEDSPKALNRTIKTVESHLEERGFELYLHEIHPDSSKLDKIIDKINNKQLDVDLILMDYRLSSGDKGNYLIEKIRNHQLYTDIIFYSQKLDLEKKQEKTEQEKQNEDPLKDMGQLEGIYLAGRDTLQIKTIMVIDNLLKKALDITGFRGLVMAETSELDDLTYQIILAFLDGDLSQNPDSEIKTIKNKYLEFLEAELTRIKKIDLKTVEGIRLITSEIGAYHRARAIARLVKNLKRTTANAGETGKEIRAKAKEIINAKFNANDYNKEILKRRNLLAHVTESINQDGEKILKSTRPGHHFVIDEAETLKARKDLKKYYEILTGIYKAVTGKDWN